MATFYVVRHAKAGSREKWEGDDSLRPLSKPGMEQAGTLVEILKPFPIAAVFSSPYLRCVQTVEPLARARRLSIKQSIALAEGHGLSGAMEFIGDPNLGSAVLSTHGDIVWELVEELVNRKLIRPGEGGFEKGSTWVVEVENGSFVRARFIPPP